MTEIAVNTNRLLSVNCLRSFQLLLECQRYMQMINLSFYSVNGTGEFTFLFKKCWLIFAGTFLFRLVSLCSLCLLCISLCVKKGCTQSVTHMKYSLHTFFFSICIFSFFHDFQMLRATALKFPHIQVQSVP